MMKNNDANLPIKKENKLNSFNTLRYNFNVANTQSETCESSVCTAYAQVSMH
jgi:hypothetical protein